MEIMKANYFFFENHQIYLVVSFFIVIFVSRNKTDRIMTQSDKELLLKDICSRLPYGVCVEHTSGFRGTLHDLTVYFTYNEDDTIEDYMCYTNFFGDEACKIEFFKPYLFPISSMTDEQKSEMELLTIGFKSPIDYSIDICNWLNKNHFDYNSLIEKGLAFDATDKNIY